MGSTPVPDPVPGSFGWTQEHQDELDRFIRICQGDGLFQKNSSWTDIDVGDGLYDEATLLRFLRARNFDAEGARRQYEESMEIRNSTCVYLEYNTIEVSEFEHARHMYPHWSGRRNHDGLPVCFFDISQLNNSTLDEYGRSRNIRKGGSQGPTPSNATRNALISHDYLSRFVLPLCSAMPDRSSPCCPVTSAVYLVDISSMTLRQGWNLRLYAQDISKLLATCYPEVINRVYVLNAPAYFGKVWGFLGKWIDPRTASKLVILSPQDVLPELTKSIDLQDIPKQLGGSFMFEHGMTPDLDSEISTKLGSLPSEVTSIPPGPIKWTMNEGVKTAIAVGSNEGQPRRVTVGFL